MFLGRATGENFPVVGSLENFWNVRIRPTARVRVDRPNHLEVAKSRLDDVWQIGNRCIHTDGSIRFHGTSRRWCRSISRVFFFIYFLYIYIFFRDNFARIRDTPVTGKYISFFNLKYYTPRNEKTWNNNSYEINLTQSYQNRDVK